MHETWTRRVTLLIVAAFSLAVAADVEAGHRHRRGGYGGGSCGSTGGYYGGGYGGGYKGGYGYGGGWGSGYARRGFRGGWGGGYYAPSYAYPSTYYGSDGLYQGGTIYGGTVYGGTTTYGDATISGGVQASGIPTAPAPQAGAGIDAGVTTDRSARATIDAQSGARLNGTITPSQSDQGANLRGQTDANIAAGADAGAATTGARAQAGAQGNLDSLDRPSTDALRNQNNERAASPPAPELPAPAP
jgi:hypothetical protein